MSIIKIYSFDSKFLAFNILFGQIYEVLRQIIHLLIWDAMCPELRMAFFAKKICVFGLIVRIICIFAMEVEPNRLFIHLRRALLFAFFIPEQR